MPVASKPLISIITPVYNVERYLPQCIESVIHQTFQDWELLLIDDGSTDRSGAICDEYALKDNRIRVLHKANSGQADSRNIALEMANGDLIGFVDSDDWIEPDMYAVLYKVLIENQADISMCGFYWDYKSGSTPTCSSEEIRIYKREESLALILEDEVIKSFLWDKLFRKYVITDLLPRSYYYEDYATLFKWFASANLVAFYQQSLYHYRQRKGSTDHDADPAKKYHFFLAELERYRYITSHGLLPEQHISFAHKVVIVGVNTAKWMCRNVSEKAVRTKYIEKIRQNLSPFLSMSFQGMKKKYYRRFQKLQRSLAWFMISMRFSGLFTLSAGKKKYKLYE